MNVIQQQNRDIYDFMYCNTQNTVALPFMQKLKLARNVLTDLKNQKLRNSQYVMEHQKSVDEQKNMNVKHEKAKLSVVDLIGQEEKFQYQQSKHLQKQNNQINSQQREYRQIQPNNARQMNSQQRIIEQSSSPEPPKMSIKQLMLQKKQNLYKQINQTSSELEQTYNQIQQLEIIFKNLCDYYSQNKHIGQKNRKIKKKIDQCKNKIISYNSVSRNSTKQITQLLDQKKQTQDLIKSILKNYLEQQIVQSQQGSKQYNDIFNFISRNNKQFQVLISGSLNIFKRTNKLQSSDQQQQNEIENKFQLKFIVLKKQLQKIKNQSISQKQKQKNFKKNDEFSLSKFYQSQMYNL